MRPKNRKGLGLLGILIAGLLWAPTVLADGKMQVIRQRMEDGLAQFVAGNPEAAAETFEAAYLEHPYSAFLFNAGVCYEKLGRTQDALNKYRRYLSVDARAPDAVEVRKRVLRLEAEQQAAEARLDQAAAEGLGKAPEPAPSVVAPESQVSADNMRSLVVIETEPAGAPVRVYKPLVEEPPPFELGGTNPQWVEATTATSPTSLALPVGLYHIVVDRFRDFNASQTQLRITPGHVHQFKANLSQGDFMGFLRVASNVKGAHIWLDDPKKVHTEWGVTPFGELVATGKHSILIELPGFQPVVTEVALESGERKELDVELVRVDYGMLRISADVPSFQLLVDGRPAGRWRKGDAPLETTAPAGMHQVTIRAEGRKPFVGDVPVPAGQVLPVRAQLIPEYPRGTAWVQAAVGGALIGGATYVGLRSRWVENDMQADRRRGTLTSEDPRAETGRWLGIAADAGFLVGGVFAGLATWNFIRDPLPDSSVRYGAIVDFTDPLRAPAARSVASRRRP